MVQQPLIVLQPLSSFRGWCENIHFYNLKPKRCSADSFLAPCPPCAYGGDKHRSHPSVQRHLSGQLLWLPMWVHLPSLWLWEIQNIKLRPNQYCFILYQFWCQTVDLDIFFLNTVQDVARCVVAFSKSLNLCIQGPKPCKDICQLAGKFCVVSFWLWTAFKRMISYRVVKERQDDLLDWM